MYDIFKKKQKYGQVSLKFRSHFNNREEKVNLVHSEDINVEQKMRIFKQLINDNMDQLNKKRNGCKLSFLKQKRKVKANQFEQKQINDLMQMTEGFNEWENMKQHRKKLKQSSLNWNHYKQEKNQRREKQFIDFKQILQQKLKLKQIRLDHSTERFQNQIQNKIRHNMLSQLGEKRFHMTCRNSPSKNSNNFGKKYSKNNFFRKQFGQTNKKKFKLAKYFGQMKQFNCHKKYYSENKVNFENRSYSENKTALETPNNKYYCGENSNSAFISHCQAVNFDIERSQIIQEIFKDDQIYEKMKALQQNAINSKLLNITRQDSNYKLKRKMSNSKNRRQWEEIDKMPKMLIKQINRKKIYLNKAGKQIGQVSAQKVQTNKQQLLTNCQNVNKINYQVNKSKQKMQDNEQKIEDSKYNQEDSGQMIKKYRQKQKQKQQQLDRDKLNAIKKIKCI